MSVDSPKAQMKRGNAAMISQRVEDNAFLGGSASPKTMTDEIARGANIWRQSRSHLANALRTTRSTCHVGNDTRLHCAVDPSDLLPSARGDGVAAFVEFDVIDEGLDGFTR